jgi:TP901 family phage tail tape measure protein
MARIQGITIELGAETRGLDKALNDVNKSTNKLQKELRQVDRLLKLDPKGSDMGKQRMELLGKAVTETEAKLKVLKEAQEEVGRTQGVDSEQYRAVQREIAATEIKLNQLKEAQKQAAIASAKAWDEAGKKIQAVGKGMQTAGKSLFRNVTLPIVAGASAVIKFGSDFEAAMTNSVSIMGDLDDAMRKTMDETAREVAKTSMVSATEAAEAYYFLASAGMTAEQSIAALPKVAQFAQAGNFDMAQATDLATDALSALGLASKDPVENLENLTRLTDVLARASQMANASIEQFSVALTTKSGTALKNFGQDMETGVAALALFADQGLKGEAAGTALTALLDSMALSVNTNAKEWDKYNIELYDSQGATRNLTDIVGDMEKAFSGMSDEQRNAALQQLGFNKQALSAVRLLLGNTDAMRQYEASLKDAGGTLDEVAGKQMESLQAQLGLLKDELIDVGLQMYESLGPVIKDTIIPLIKEFAAKLAELAEWFGGLDTETQKTYMRWTAAAAAAGPLLIVLGKLVTIIGGIVRGMAAVKLAFSTAGWIGGATTGFWGLNSALAANAATLGVVGLAFGALAFYLRDTDDLVRASIESGEKQRDVWSDWYMMLGPIPGLMKVIKDGLFDMRYGQALANQELEVAEDRHRRVADAVQRQIDKIDGLNDAQGNWENAARRVEQAEIRLERSTERSKEARARYNKMQQDGTATTKELREAYFVFREAVIEAEDAERDLLRARREQDEFSPDYENEIEDTRRLAQAADLASNAFDTLQRNMKKVPGSISGGRQITVNARGAIYSSPTLGVFGEDGPEAIIPLSSKYRREGTDLIQQAAKMMGLSTGGGVTIAVDARGSTDPYAVEAAARRGAAAGMSAAVRSGRLKTSMMGA